jgi:hypothetical protein
MKETGI